MDKPEVLDKVAFWPLAKLDGPAAARERTFLFIRGGADLLVKAGGATYCFNMASRGHEAAGFASAQDFRDHINRLRR